MFYFLFEEGRYFIDKFCVLTAVEKTDLLMHAEPC